MASFIVDSCRDQRFSFETWDESKNDRLGSMHTSDHRRSVWYKISGLTPSYEALGRLLKKKKTRIIMMTKIRISHMSDFSCGETKVRNDP